VSVVIVHLLINCASLLNDIHLSLHRTITKLRFVVLVVHVSVDVCIVGKSGLNLVVLSYFLQTWSECYGV